MLKTITAALAADTTLLTITDAAINDSSIIEVYTDDDDLFPKSISQTGNTLSIIFDEQITVHAVKILVNNLSGEFNPFSGDYNDLSNKPSIPSIDVIPLLEEGEHIADIDLNGETYSLYAPEGSAEEVSAEDVSYDNSVSELLAENVQNAIDELSTQKQPLLTAGDGIDITDNVISATGGGGSNIYPLNEQTVVIGKWGDRDVKRKCFSGNAIVAGYNNYFVEVNAKVLNVFGSISNNPSGLFPSYETNWNILCYFSESTGYLDLRLGASYNGSPYIFFVDYIAPEEV